MRKGQRRQIREAIKKGGDPYEIARLGLSATDETPPGAAIWSTTPAWKAGRTVEREPERPAGVSG